MMQVRCVSLGVGSVTNSPPHNRKNGGSSSKWWPASLPVVAHLLQARLDASDFDRLHHLPLGFDGLITFSGAPPTDVCITSESDRIPPQ